MKTPTCRCGTSWHQRGDATAHCASCHRTFTSTHGFDSHRRDGEGGTRVCVDPNAMHRRDGSPMFTLRPDPIGAPVWEHHSAAAARLAFKRAEPGTRNNPLGDVANGKSRANSPAR
jgi:hypothetical protein